MSMGMPLQLYAYAGRRECIEAPSHQICIVPAGMFVELRESFRQIIHIRRHFRQRNPGMHAQAPVYKSHSWAKNSHARATRVVARGLSGARGPARARARAL
jgi:hypothetical protein